MPDTANALAPQPLSAKTPEASLFRLIADAVPALIAYFESDTLVCRFANQGYASYNGHTTQSIVGLTVQEAVGDAAWEAIRPHVERCLQGEHVKYVREQTLPSGARRMIEVNLIPHFGEARTQLGSFVLINDITHHWLAERFVRESEERMRKFAAATEEAIVFHQGGTIIDGNEALQRLSGYPLAQILGRSTQEFVAPRYRAMSAAYLLRGDEYLYEAALVHRDGHEVPVEIVGKTMPRQDASYRIAVLRDISVRKKAQQREAFVALHDTLTQLPNRRHLMEQLQATVDQARHAQTQVAVLFIDLDHFKKINDSHGHQAGDQLLVVAAQRMRDLLRDVDALGRQGGDEFIIVLGGPLTPDSVSAVAVRVVQSLTAPYQLDVGTVHSGASVGVALYPDDGADRETLLRHADMAMYAAKREGRGNFQFFSPAMNAATHEHLMIENRMWLALEHDDFELHLQAQVALSTGRLIGAEALLRWHDQELGNVEPGRFIPIAEESGLIVPLGDWVLARAMQQLADWQRDGLGALRLAVNLSARQFSGGALVARLDQLLAQHRIDPSRLELEITETAAMRDPDNTRALLRQLRGRGFKLAIDDFGTGYSSLAYLKQFAIDRIKIDRAFVQDIETNPNDAVIVAATIGMAHSLGLAVVAEGVETRGQWGFLRDKRGDEAQGFLFGRPMAPAAFRDFIREPALQVPGL
jgi:diguanylate cyclase (GGDEF)-like protein/PAS domain S-box-containing protein